MNVERPPEDIFHAVAGSCGRWQIGIVIFAFIALCFDTLGLLSSNWSTPDFLNYTCNAENSTQCFYGNGTKCVEFKYFPEDNLETFTKMFSLVCEQEHYAAGIKMSFLAGKMVSAVITGLIADKIGRMNTVMIFIPLLSLCGVFLLLVRWLEMLIFLAIVQGLCSSYLYLLPKIIVCETIGNKWRTVLLGITTFSAPLSLTISPYFFALFHHVHQIITVISVLPFTLLIPVMCFKDPPINFFLSVDLEKAKKILHKAIRFNRKHIDAVDLQIKPLNVIGSDIFPKNNQYFWLSPGIRYVWLALMCHWFFLGFCIYVFFTLIFHVETPFYYIGLMGVFGITVAICMCCFIGHRIVIGIFQFLTNFSTFTIFLFDAYFIRSDNSTFFILALVSSFLIFGSFGVLDNVTPRMFPTISRALATGSCVSSFYFGTFTASLMDLCLRKNFIWGVGLVLVIVSPVSESVATFWIWNVHNRELPDYFTDAVNFKKSHKPVRYAPVGGIIANPYHESEVGAMSLNDADSLEQAFKPKRRKK